MLNKRWHKSQLAILNSGLAAFIIVTFLILGIEVALWLRLLLLFPSYFALGFLVRWLNDRFADGVVKVFPADYLAVANAVQRMLNRDRIPFFKRTNDERIDFTVRLSHFTLLVESFPLNLPIDSHLKSVPATKITIRPAGQAADPVAKKLQAQLDSLFSTWPEALKSASD